MLCKGKHTDSKALPSNSVVTSGDIDVTAMVPHLPVIFQNRPQLANWVSKPEQVVGKGPTVSGIHCYNMSHPKRGNCFIFYHTTYCNPSLKPREGAQMDVELIRQRFGRLRFEVEAHQDKNKKELLDLLKQSKE